MNKELTGIMGLGITIVEHGGVEVYYTFEDNDDVNNGPNSYWYTCDLGDSDAEFDIRELASYDEKLSHEEILIKAIDLGLIQ